jgi:hypothetical protein
MIRTTENIGSRVLSSEKFVDDTWKTAEVFHDGSVEGQKAFLASFTSEEDHRIIRKVDRNFSLSLV